LNAVLPPAKNVLWKYQSDDGLHPVTGFYFNTPVRDAIERNIPGIKKEKVSLLVPGNDHKNAAT